MQNFMGTHLTLTFDSISEPELMDQNVVRPNQSTEIAVSMYH